MSTCTVARIRIEDDRAGMDDFVGKLVSEEGPTMCSCLLVSQVAERLGNLASNQKIAGLIPGSVK